MFKKMLIKFGRLILRLGGLGKDLENIASVVIVHPGFSDRDVWNVEFVSEVGPNQIHLLCFEEIGKFIEASKQLHYYPGINPYNNQKTPKLKEILVSRLCTTGPFWWTAPGLGNDVPKEQSYAPPGGAILLEWRQRYRIPLNQFAPGDRWHDYKFTVDSTTVTA